MEEEPTEDILYANASRMLGDMFGGGIEREGDHIGPYQLCERLGEGGFGIVWRAQQTEPVRREVALKILKLGMDTRKVLRRFSQERQALATLEHPGIATLLDAGVTGDNRPWFAMELVKGAPITEWGVEHQLPLDERLRLFNEVCLAVHHAHQHGIIHRDLKPSNVLVTQVASRPVAKVIDFGIAKSVQTEADASLLTMTGQRLGTPFYMSPEQTEDSAGVDVRSDVYALGVLLYELLTQELPIDGHTIGSDDEDKIKRAIRERTPERPSKRTHSHTTTTSGKPAATLAPRLSISPNLDWIALRALEKEPARRYQTAAELAEDVRRHLDHEAVLARPPGIAYAMGRWARRRKRVLLASAFGVAATSVLIFASLQVLNHTRDVTVAPPPVQPAAPVAQAPKPPPPVVFPDPLPAAEVAARSVTNSLGMKFVPVPGSDVLFCIHETRHRDYAAYIDRTPPQNKNAKWLMQTAGPVPVGVGDDDPVVGVNWDDAQAFCAWLSQVEGKLYRLPTDHEWSLAAGIGSLETGYEKSTPEELGRNGKAVFPPGIVFPPPPGSRAGNYADETMDSVLHNTQWLHGYDDGFATVAPVMSFQATPFGLFDLSGNVWEWCEDKMKPESPERVTRGGGWSDSTSAQLRLTARRAVKQDITGSQTGFRCVLVPGEKPPPPQGKPAGPGYKPPPPITPPHPMAVSALQAQTQPRFPESMSLADTQKQAITNSLGMKLLPVAGTSVLFCIHETRYRDYAAYAAATPGADKGWQTQTGSPNQLPGDKTEHPVCNVNWQDAQDFCAWLSKKEGHAYRLPTDREWSYACGIGALETWKPDTTPQSVLKIQNQYPWEGPYPPTEGAGNLSDESRGNENRNGGGIIEGYNDGFPRTAPVMSFKPNTRGLFDMSGNVLEWCEDAFDNRHLDIGLRGAAWYIGGNMWTLSSFRLPCKYTQRGAGFRIVLEP